MQILIDARKAFDSGIGTYIRCVVPRVIARFSGVSFSALIESGGQARHDYLAPGTVRFIESDARPLGVREQIDLRRLTKDADLFWATSLAHPLFTRTPMLATVHDVAQLAMGSHGPSELLVRSAARLFFRSLRSRGQLILFNSAFTASEFVRYVGTARHRSLVTPLGVEPVWFGGVAVPSDSRPPRFVCIGNLRPHKNLVLLLQAFEGLAARIPHRLVLVGKAEGYRTNDTQTRELIRRLSHRLDFTGFLSDEALRELLPGADGLVVPSLYEGFGLPALEAMAAGVPVIAARAAALPEVCGDCADYFDPTSRESLEACLLAQTLRTDVDRQARIGAARQRAREFTWDSTAELTARALSELLDAGLKTP